MTEPSIGEFRCTRCGSCHPIGEPGFRLPDAALAVPMDERESRVREDGDVAMVAGDAFFIRGWLPIGVEGLTWGIGFWVQVSAESYEDFERRGRVGHTPYQGRIANQADYLGPTLGLGASMESVGPGQRPRLRVADRGGPLGRAQFGPLPRRIVDGWMSRDFHEGEPEPPREPFAATMAEHGFEIVDPRDADRVAVTMPGSPTIGDHVKVIVRFEGATQSGDPVALLAGWWLRLDDVSRPRRLGGTLANRPRIPATLALGSRLWVRPEDVIEHTAAADLEP